MATEQKTSELILLKLLKEPFTKHTATSLAEAINITRQGLWKSLHKLAEKKLIVLEKLGEKEKSTVQIILHWNNPLTIKTLSLLLTQEALEYERWQVNFLELKPSLYFLILFGSILNDFKKANDIDILIIAKKNNFKPIGGTISKIQKTQLKKIHVIELTEEEFAGELKKKNKAYLDALKKGIILFGQENYLQFSEERIKV